MANIIGPGDVASGQWQGDSSYVPNITLDANSTYQMTLSLPESVGFLAGIIQSGISAALAAFGLNVQSVTANGNSIVIAFNT